MIDINNNYQKLQQQLQYYEQNKNMRVDKSTLDKVVLSSEVFNKPKTSHQTLTTAKLRGYKTCQIDRSIFSKNLGQNRKTPNKFDSLIPDNREQQKQNIKGQIQGIQQKKAKTCSEFFNRSQVQKKSQSKLYHPTIYHYPQVRKKYFCQVVDSYFSKSTLPVQCSFEKSKGTKKNNFLQRNKNVSSRMLAESCRPITTDRNRKLSSKVINKIYGISVINEHQKFVLNVIQPQQSNDNVFAPTLKKLKSKLKLASATANSSFGVSQRTKRSKNLVKLNLNLNTTASISYDNISNQDQSKQKETFSQSIESIQKSRTPSRHGQSINVKKYAQNSLIIKLKQQLTKIPQRLLQEIKERLGQIKIIMDEQSSACKILSQQKMSRTLGLIISESSTLRKYYGNKIRIKEYKQDLISKQMANKIQKIKQLKVTNLWNPLPKAAKARLNQSNLFYSPFCKSLREQFFLFKLNEKTQNDGLSYTIHATSNYFQLFEHNCQYFRDIIISLAEDLVKMRGRLINNNISLDNVYRLQEKCIKIGDWGHSAMCNKFLVVGEQITLKDQPILTIQEAEGHQGETGKNYKWLVSPQNLPPQIIRCLMENKYELIWDKDDSPEVWSLGIMIFELLTAVPVWMPCPTAAWYKTARVGYFYDPRKRLSCIYEFQTKLPNIINRWLRDEKNFILNNKIHPQILHLMKQMLHINAKLRPKPQQIIRKLKSI